MGLKANNETMLEENVQERRMENWQSFGWNRKFSYDPKNEKFLSFLGRKCVRERVRSE